MAEVTEQLAKALLVAQGRLAYLHEVFTAPNFTDRYDDGAAIANTLGTIRAALANYETSKARPEPTEWR
jgi:hypothetical protein